MVEEAIPGDGNCDGATDARDALDLLLMRRWEKYVDCYGSAKLGCDLYIETKDVLWVLMHVAGLDDSPLTGCVSGPEPTE